MSKDAWFTARLITLIVRSEYKEARDVKDSNLHLSAISLSVLPVELTSPTALLIPRVREPLERTRSSVPVQLKVFLAWWRCGESNPDRLRAKQECSRYHYIPMEAGVRIERQKKGYEPSQETSP